MRLKTNIDKGPVSIVNDLLAAGESFKNNKANDNLNNKEKLDWRHNPWAYHAELDEEEHKNNNLNNGK